MKRLIYILALLMLAMPAEAQDEPKMLTFSHTVYCPGVNEKDIAKKANTWLKSCEDFKSCFYHFYSNDSFHGLYNWGYVTYQLMDCPNFGISEFLGGGSSRISVDVEVVAKNNAYTVSVVRIDSWDNPSLGILYGENGQLYPELYTKKQLKLSVPIIEYVSDIADGIFREFDEYMQQQ